MDDQLKIDSSGAWVRKAAQLIADKPLLTLEHFGGLNSNVGKPYDEISEFYEQTQSALIDD